jgi:hypothetical protein
VNLGNWSFYILLFTLTAISARAGEVTIESKSDATLLAVEGNQTTNLKANEAQTVPFAGPIMVREKGKIPALLIPVSPNAAHVNLDLPSANEVMAEASAEKIDQNLARLMMGMEEINSAIRKQDVKEAKVRFQHLSETYPHVDFLAFTKASITLLEGNRAEALKIAEQALEKFPDYTPGKNFVDRLRGKNP